MRSLYEGRSSLPTVAYSLADTKTPGPRWAGGMLRSKAHLLSHMHGHFLESSNCGGK